MAASCPSWSGPMAVSNKDSAIALDVLSSCWLLAAGRSNNIPSTQPGAAVPPVFGGVNFAVTDTKSRTASKIGTAINAYRYQAMRHSGWLVASFISLLLTMPVYGQRYDKPS